MKTIRAQNLSHEDWLTIFMAMNDKKLKLKPWFDRTWKPEEFELVK